MMHQLKVRSHPLRRFVRAFSAVMLAVVAAAAQGRDSLTVDNAVEIVLQRNPSVAQATEALEAARELTLGLKSANYPSVKASLSDVYLGPEYPFNFNGTPFRMYPDNNFDAHISAEYSIFDFGKRSVKIKNGIVGEAIGEDNLQNIKAGLSFQIVQIFHNILLLEKSVEVADDGIAELDRHLLIVKKKLETGSATEYDVLKTEVQRAAAQSQLIDIENDRAKKQASLRQLLGLAPDAPLYLKGSFDASQTRLNQDSLVECAIKSRTEHTLALHKVESAKLQRESAHRENLPDLGGYVSTGFKNGFPDEAAPPKTNISTPRINWGVGAQATIPIYDGMKTKHHESEAERNELATAAGLKDIEERIKVEVLQAKTDVESAFAKLAVSATQVRFAGESLTLARLKYEAGVITNHDVLDAENDLEQAKLGHLQNQYRYVMSLYALDQATGKKIYAGN
ncbi:MAG: TolC family protein [Chitinispirillaceae bacterium]|jgi:outer membrane protein TolC